MGGEPLLYFVILAEIMWLIVLMVRLSALVGKVHSVKDKIHALKGERPEEEPEWL